MVDLSEAQWKVNNCPECTNSWKQAFHDKIQTWKVKYNLGNLNEVQNLHKDHEQFTSAHKLGGTPNPDCTEGLNTSHQAEYLYHARNFKDLDQKLPAEPNGGKPSSAPGRRGGIPVGGNRVHTTTAQSAFENYRGGRLADLKHHINVRVSDWSNPAIAPVPNAPTWLFALPGRSDKDKLEPRKDRIADRLNLDSRLTYIPAGQYPEPPNEDAYFILRTSLTIADLERDDRIVLAKPTAFDPDLGQLILAWKPGGRTQPATAGAPELREIVAGRLHWGDLVLVAYND